MMRAAIPILAPGGRGLSLQALARAGATLAGRAVAVDGEQVGFDDSAAANVAAGDAFAARVRAMVDETIRRAGLDAPPGEPDDADLPCDLDPPAVLDLRAAAVGSVVWCTGFTGDFSWLDPALVDADGRPRHSAGAGALPGVWYVGLRWLSHRASDTLYGFPRDAARVADAVRAHLARLTPLVHSTPRLGFERPPRDGARGMLPRHRGVDPMAELSRDVGHPVVIESRPAGSDDGCPLDVRGIGCWSQSRKQARHADQSRQ